MTTPSEQDSSAEPTEKALSYNLSDINDIFKMFFNKLNEEQMKSIVSLHFNSLIAKYGFSNYQVVILFDESTSITMHEADRIYEAISNNTDRDILLILHSNGGRIEPAYLISKTCKQLSREKFVVAVPRRAKSAATLIALGAKEIHMGLMSELGPIDPQISGYPALGLGNSLGVLAKLVCDQPGAAPLFSEYLVKKLDLVNLGYFERISESAVQYAERLLKGKEFPDGQTAEGIAKKLVYDYKDHGFVIDVDEAASLLGSQIRQNTSEYNFSNEIYSLLSTLDFAMRFLQKRTVYLYGTLESGFSVRDQ